MSKPKQHQTLFLVLRQAINAGCTLVLAALLTACGQQANTSESVQPVAFESGDECHLCGMLIERFAGPKGELQFDRKMVKFCSTKDMAAFYLDEENTHRVKQIFVHDMAATPWETPEDKHLINGRQAWYVVGSSKMGAMGATLATFATQAQAQAFSLEHGGDVLAFTDLSQQVLMSPVPAKMGHSQHTESNGHHHHH